MSMSLGNIYLQVLDFQNDVFRTKMQSFSRQQQKIISFLAEKYAKRYPLGQIPVDVKTIAKRLFLSSQTVSSQLKSLKDAGVVDRHDVGRRSLYELSDVQFCHWLDIKAGRSERVKTYANFVDNFYS